MARSLFAVMVMGVLKGLVVVEGLVAMSQVVVVVDGMVWLGARSRCWCCFFFVLFSRGTGVHCGNGLTCCSVVCVSYGLVRGGRMAVALHVFMPVLEEG